MADENYSAGDLNLTIDTISESTIRSLDAVIVRLDSIKNGFGKINVKGLDQLSRSINSIVDADVDLVGEKIDILFSKISNSTNSINTKNLDILVSASKSISSISKISTLGNLDFEKIGNGFEELSIHISPFLQQVKEAETSLTALYGILSKVKNVDNIVGGNAKPRGGINDLFNLAKFGLVINYAKRLGRAVADISKSGADYVETLNLWEVAMGDFSSQATLFVNKMNEAYGISEKTLMNAQATFKNMLGSLGNISDEMAYNLSENVTRMAVDYASLYNVEIEEAMTKFQAALAGQVRPIRSVSGYDITENTLYQLYESIGGTKSIRQLSQTEKRLLAIYAIFNQMSGSGAIGDMQKTIESFANQSRIMAESWDRTTSYLGLIITKLLTSFGIMSNINAILIFTSEVFKAIADRMGAIESQGGDAFGDLTNGANDASKAIDEVNGKLLGFDKFRSLSGTEEDDVAIDEALANAMGDYESKLKSSSFAANDIAKGWLETIGLTYDAETGAYKVGKTFEGIADTVSMLVSLLVGFGATLGGKLILGNIDKITKAFGGLGTKLQGVFSLKNIGIMALVAALYYMYTTNEDFRKSVDLLFESLMNLVGSVMEPILGLLVGITPILTQVLETIAELLAPVIEIIANVINFLAEAGILKGVLIALAAVIGAVTIAIWAQNAAWLANPVTWIILGIVAAVALIGTVIYSVIENIDEVWAAIKGVLRGLGNFFANIGIGVANGFIALVNMLIDFINILIKPLDAIAEVFGYNFQIPSWNAKIEYSPIPEFKNGGLPDKGSMFIAGEAGAEYVYNMPNGQSGVANVQQIAQATYSGTMRALNDWWGGSQARGDIPQLREANATGMYQAVTGVAKSYGEKWSKY